MCKFAALWLIIQTDSAFLPFAYQLACLAQELALRSSQDAPFHPARARKGINLVCVLQRDHS